MEVLITARKSKALQGIASVNRSTKQLLRTVKPGQIAVIAHQDIDEMAAEGLIRARVKAVVNAAPSMTGTYPVNGAALLLRAGIPIYEVAAPYFIHFDNGLHLSIDDTVIEVAQQTIPCTPFTLAHVMYFSERAQQSLDDQLHLFIHNTLQHARLEKNEVLQPLLLPSMSTVLANRHVVIVVRGSGYRDDLFALDEYIQTVHPVLIGVDGGADAIIEYGYVPDIIIGDMDSVSDEALTCGAELIVHAYLDGRAPGLARVHSLGLDACTIRAKGISEDVALLFAYEQQAVLIVGVGHHSHMTDFLAKGRQGMASTLLVRLKVGAKFIDAKGVSKLFTHRPYVTGRGIDGREGFYYYPGME